MGLKSQETRQSVPQLIQASNKENIIKLHITGPIQGEEANDD